MTHLSDDDQPTASTGFTIETGVTRQLEGDYSRATLEVTRKATADRTLLVGFGGHWGTTTTELTPTEAREFASALERMAKELEAPEQTAPDEAQSSTAATPTNTHEPSLTPDEAVESPEESHEQ